MVLNVGCGIDHEGSICARFWHPGAWVGFVIITKAGVAINTEIKIKWYSCRPVRNVVGTALLPIFFVNCQTQYVPMQITI